jgi:hypothetical protein
MDENRKSPMLSSELRLFALLLAIAFLFFSPSSGQNRAAPAAPPTKARPSSKDAKSENEAREQETRALMLQRLRREHSDASGRLRPDLFAKAIAQIQRMKVAKQIGPGPTVSPDKK